jgi:hypothetical protein
MLAMILILLVTLGNFALGFVLATHFGHGPAWGQVLTSDKVRTRLRSALGMNKT